MSAAGRGAWRRVGRDPALALHIEVLVTMTVAAGLQSPQVWKGQCLSPRSVAFRTQEAIGGPPLAAGPLTLARRHPGVVAGRGSGLRDRQSEGDSDFSR